MSVAPNDIPEGVRSAGVRFGLTWPGKAEAAALAATPTRTIARGLSAESVEWERTRNLFIEGDNLDALKLLRGAYRDKVNVLYIDPPYNTGNEFIYPDRFSTGVRAYQEQKGRGGDGGIGEEDDGRFHTNWLNMMYPRLLLARELLAPDGVGFISLDGNEAAHCRLMLGEIFGEKNYISTIVWVSNLKGRQISDGGPAGTHEYILCFARDASQVRRFRGSASEFRRLMPSIYKGPAYHVHHDERGAYVIKNELHNTNSKFNERTAPTMVFNIHHNFATGETRVTDVDDPATFEGFCVIRPHPNARPGLSHHAWRWSRARVLADAHDLKFVQTAQGARVYTKVRDVDGMSFKDVIMGPSTMSGHADLAALGLARAFDTAKPVDVLRMLIATSAGKDAVVMDFFAGSASTGHAVMEQNRLDGGQRRFVLVQLPVALDAEDETARIAAEVCAANGRPPTIAEVAKERLRRAGSVVRASAGGADCDVGFRVVRLESPNDSTTADAAEAPHIAAWHVG